MPVKIVRKCSCCKTPNTNKINCPLNDKAAKPNKKTHILANKLKVCLSSKKTSKKKVRQINIVGLSLLKPKYQLSL